MATSAEAKVQLHEPHVDLRDWLTRVDAIGELTKIEGVDWNLEMGVIASESSNNAKEGGALAAR